MVLRDFQQFVMIAHVYVNQRCPPYLLVVVEQETKSLNKKQKKLGGPE